MSETNLVRASRDGDQFHYLWAARRCLLLISPTASLRAVTIEGASPSEADAADRLITAGEELIDVGEYYGSENLERATLIRYIQLKHSTVRADKAWTPSELEKTLKGFAIRYKALQQRLGAVDLSGKLEFWFVSNRPVNTDFLETVTGIAEGVPTRHTVNLQKLERFTNLSGTSLAAFCKLLRLEGNQEGLWDQQNILAQNVSHYLVDADVDAPVQLKELVTKKALSASAGNPAITRIDVFRALQTDESRLFPAPCLIKDLENVISREQERDILHAIVQAGGIPVIVHAAGGVGKSVFATRIKLGLPTGSSSVLYDCFGNGQYRSTSGYRHRHKDALGQIVNELAAKGLCHPLIPSPYAEPSAYVKAFLYRLRQSITSLRTKNAQALLCIIIDAADNAQMAAEEIGEARSFIRDLIREQLPEGVRLVVLCRTHRQEYLAPPPDTLRLELHPFSRTETAAYLRQVFIDATEQDIDEFHRLSSQNPCVQALALSRKASLGETLRTLGPNPTTVKDTIGNLLDASIARLRDAVGVVEKTQIDRICAGLAVLRPLIPLSVLGSMSGVDEAAIKSFAFDLGCPLLVTGDTIQFFDEPAETWFRERFKPTAGDLAAFVASLNPRIKLEDNGRWDSEGNTNRAVTALVEAAHKLSAGTTNGLIDLLTRYLPASPPRGLSSRYGGLRFPLLRAYALRAALSGQTLNLHDLAHDDLRKELEAAKLHSESRDAREFKEDIGALLPWHLLWAETFVGRTSLTDLANAITETKAASAKAERVSYREESNTSDWRDRDFGWAGRILPTAINFLIARGDLDPKVALALIGFRAQWDEPLLLKSVLVACTKAEKEVAAGFVYRYMTLGQQSVGTWRGLKSVLAEHGIAPAGLDERIALSEREEQSSKSRENSYDIDRAAAQESKEERDWNVIFEGVDLSVANDISQAHRRFKDFEPPYYHERFFEEACRRVHVGKEAEFIAAIADATDFDLYHLRNFLEQFPENWKSRLAVKPALAQTLKVFCRRFCMAITKSRYYERLPFKTACELSGLPEGDVVDVVLAAIGEATEIAGASRLFTLVGLLAPKLTENEALEVLSFGLDLFDPILEDADGDGLWSPKLEPPAEIEGSVAGYIWGCLAVPRASLRWEVAHVVRALCILGHEKVLEHLITLYVTDLMKLNSDVEHRRWFVQDDHVDVAWSQVWGRFHEKDDNETNHESGARFQASFAVIVSLLRELKMDLIVEIEIERRRRYSRWERNNDDDIGFILPSARLFLIRSDGSISTL